MLPIPGWFTPDDLVECFGPGLKLHFTKIPTAAERRAERQRQCKHGNRYVKTYGLTGMISDVICPDCGWSRARNVY